VSLIDVFIDLMLIKQHPVNPEQQHLPIAQNSNPWNSNGSPQNANLAAQIEAINTQQMKLREQIIQSEKNLQAQHQVYSSTHFISFMRC
jgi:hypothetical protein